MLELENIRKIYVTGDQTLAALDGVSLCFRENEFVSILGPSGCGKTTMLNIIGGLDRYTSGDLIINGRSTESYKDKDWDAYRNHSIGFVFQSYNLIPHQTVLENVELALTLSGVSKAVRKEKAIKALQKVGLGDHIHKKPNQMSGGQMQRVAIARALVNDPDILLADEPTGALDTNTSVQIMDLLKEVASDRLVIMVTHNPELAEQYSTRIVRLSDGKVVGDTNPISQGEYKALVKRDEAALAALKKNKKLEKAKTKKKSMSFFTAISLSFKNLLTKKGRTILTSFAGSIGIIGIALILALSNGINIFINNVQENTLSTYPITVEKEASDTSAMISAMTQVDEDKNAEDRDPSKIYVDDSMGNLVNALSSTKENNLEAFKKYIDKNYDEKLKPYVSDVQYTYALNLTTYSIVPTKEDASKNRVTELGLGNMLNNMGSDFAGMSSLVSSSGMLSVMSEMIDNQELLDQQYEIVSGKWPEKENEIVLVVNKNNTLSRMSLYMLGLLDQGDLEGMMSNLMTGKEIEYEEIDPFTFEELMNTNLYFVNTEKFFVETDKVHPSNSEYHLYEDVRLSPNYNEENFITENGMKLKISGIIRPKKEATSTSISTPLAYTHMLTDAVLKMNAESEVINIQKKYPDINVTNGRPHELKDKEYTVENVDELFDTFDANTMNLISARFGGIIAGTFPTLSEEEKFSQFTLYATLLPLESKQELISAMYDKALEKFGGNEAMLLAMLNQRTTINKDGVFNIASKNDLLLCLPSIVQSDEGAPIMQSKTIQLVGFFAGVCKDDIQPFYDMLQKNLPSAQLSKEICVMFIQGMAKDGEMDGVVTDNANMSVDDVIEMLKTMAPESDATYDSTLKKLGNADEPLPASINFYAKDFNSKENIDAFIKEYNANVKETKDKIEYTDVMGLLLSSVTIIVDVISYVLIAFVSISLIVSSIMIGIITNISVLERTKEIGILRAIGASKRDVSRVFNAETFIIGLAAGILGIVVTLILCIPANAIIYALTDFADVKAVLPPVAAVILVIISMLLTMIAGIIPARSASKKDPVVALRTE